MRKKRTWIGALGERLDIPRELLPGGFFLTLSDSHEAIVRGCRRILSYGEREIVLSLGGQRLAIRGQGLLCSAFEAGCVTVRGNISQLSLEGGGRHAD